MLDYLEHDLGWHYRIRVKNDLLRRLLKIMPTDLKEPRAPTDNPHMPVSLFLFALVNMGAATR